MTKNYGLVIVLSGPSGVGKGTVNRILQKTNTQVAAAVSATTRAPREGEVEGVSYYFKTQEQFEKLIHEDCFVEYACVYGNCYGTLKSELERIIGSGMNVVLEIDTVGAMNIKRIMPDSVAIFVLPPSLNELEKRIRGRGTDEATLNVRIIAAKEEIAFARNYDYIVINDEATRCAAEVATIIRAESLKVKNNSQIIDDLIGGNNIC